MAIADGGVRHSETGLRFGYQASAKARKETIDTVIHPMCPVVAANVRIVGHRFVMTTRIFTAPESRGIRKVVESAIIESGRRSRAEPSDKSRAGGSNTCRLGRPGGFFLILPKMPSCRCGRPNATILVGLVGDASSGGDSFSRHKGRLRANEPKV